MSGSGEPVYCHLCARGKHPKLVLLVRAGRFYLHAANAERGRECHVTQFVELPNRPKEPPSRERD